MIELERLSAEGRRRRAEILGLARREAGRLRRRRTAAEGAAALLIAIGSALLMRMAVPDFPLSRMAAARQADRPSRVAPLALKSGPEPSAPAVAASARRPAPRAARQEPVHAPRAIVIRYLGTEPGLSRQLAVRGARPAWPRLSDEELIYALAKAGHPAGIAWMNGREMLVFRAAADPGDLRWRPAVAVVRNASHVAASARHAEKSGGSRTSGV